MVAGIIAEEVMGGQAMIRLTRLTRLTTEQAQLESRAVSLPGSGLCPLCPLQFTVPPSGSPPLIRPFQPSLALMSVELVPGP